MQTRFYYRILDFLVAAIFILAGLTKLVVIDQLLIDLRHFETARLADDILHLSLANPVGFARDIDNYKILPWPAAVALALYLPWLEILCGLALIVRRLYRGAILLLTGLT